MDTQKGYEDFTLQQKIILQLLLRASIGWNVGLYDGKMGLILFFSHFFKQTGNLVYDDTANELTNELKEEIHADLPVGFASGLSGIGWGMEYLIQNGFVDDDSLQVCLEIDKKIMEKDPLRMTDYSLETGLEGILHYVLMHIKGVMSQHASLPFDEVYLGDLYQAVLKMPDTGMSEGMEKLSVAYSVFYKNRQKIDYSFQLSSIIGDIEVGKEKLDRFPLGLKKGLSGFMLKNLIQDVP